MTSGTLTLHAYPVQPFTESLNPLLNTTRWARRNRVTIDIANSSGTLQRHPRGSLRILRTPKSPSRTKTKLEISIGCILTQQDYRNPSGEDSAVTPGTDTARHLVINSLAAKARVPALIDEILEWPINFPVSRLSGSYVQQMGQLAYAAGYVLWIDKDEQLRATRIPDNPDPDFVFNVGEDESLFDVIDGQETPCEVVRATTTLPEVKQTIDPEPELYVSRTDEYSPSEVGFAYQSGMATAEPYSYRRIRQPKGLLLPDKYPNSPSLATALTERTYTRYQETEEGFLLYTKVNSRAPKGVVLPELYPGELQDIASQEVITSYVYVEGATVRIDTRTYEPQALIDPDNTNLVTKTSLGLSQHDTEKYTKTNKGWVKSTYRRSYKKGESSTSSTSFSASGNNTPPAPEQRQQEFYIEEKQLSSKVEFGEVTGLANDERDRPFDIPTAVSRQQLKYLAKLIGKRLWGQVQGCTWGMDFKNEWFDYAPLRGIDFVVPGDYSDNATRMRYLIVGETFSMTNRQAAVAGDGIHVGRIRRYRTDGSSEPPTSPDQPLDPNEAEYLEPPYQEVSSIGVDGATVGNTTGMLEFFGTIDVIPYETDSGTTDVFGLVEFLAESDELNQGLFLIEFFGNFGEGALIDFDWIVISGGQVVVSGGNVVSSEGDFSEIVTSNGQVITSGGNVVSTGSSAEWNSILIAEGEVVVSDGNVVVVEE